MERLTFEGNFCDISQCRELSCQYGRNCMQKQVWERLKSYEDTSLSPEGLKQACEIEEHSADVAEVVHAQWEEADWREYDDQSCETIRYPKAAIVCTNCRCAFKKDALWERNFCPNCGAKMDGSVDNGE